jgi:hypothetical protein
VVGEAVGNASSPLCPNCKLHKKIEENNNVSEQVILYKGEEHLLKALKWWHGISTHHVS